VKRILIALIAVTFVTGAIAQVSPTEASARMAEVVTLASQAGWLQTAPADAFDYIFEVEPFILDVRNPDEFDDGYVEGAVNVPVTQLAENLDKLPASLDTPIVVYCAAGTRGFWAQAYLMSLGYNNVRNVRGGFGAWMDAGLPFVN